MPLNSYRLFDDEVFLMFDSLDGIYGVYFFVIKRSEFKVLGDIMVKCGVNNPTFKLRTLVEVIEFEKKVVII